MAGRLVHKVENGKYTAKVYYDPHMQEYTVRFFARNKWISDCDYFTEEEDDAIGTALAEINKMAKSKIL